MPFVIIADWRLAFYGRVYPVIGDLRALVATGWSGCRGMERLCKEPKLESLREASDELIVSTETGIRAGIQGLLDGECSETLYMDSMELISHNL